jgi:hypothetical protein
MAESQNVPFDWTVKNLLEAYSSKCQSIRAENANMTV